MIQSQFSFAYKTQRASDGWCNQRTGKQTINVPLGVSLDLLDAGLAGVPPVAVHDDGYVPGHLARSQDLDHQRLHPGQRALSYPRHPGRAAYVPSRFQRPVRSCPCERFLISAGQQCRRLIAAAASAGVPKIARSSLMPMAHRCWSLQWWRWWSRTSTTRHLLDTTPSRAASGVGDDSFRFRRSSWRWGVRSYESRTMMTTM